jgi:hypothetical protein
MNKPDISQQDEALVAVLTSLGFRRALLPLALISTITLAGMMLSMLT